MNKATLISLLESGLELRDSSVLMEGSGAKARRRARGGGPMPIHTPPHQDGPRLKRIKSVVKSGIEAVRPHAGKIAKGLAGVGALAAGIGLGRKVIGHHKPTAIPHPSSAHIASVKAFAGQHGGKVAAVGAGLVGLSLLRRKNKKNRR